MSGRFYYPHSLESPSVQLKGSEAKHMTQVLRIPVGETVCLFDGRGTEALAEIVSSSKRAVELQILERRTVTEETETSLILATAVPKGDRFRWLVEKATELGVSRLIPLRTERSIVHPGEGKLEKMRQTVVAASKQSGRSTLMQIDKTIGWNDLIEQEFPHRHVLIAHPSGSPLNLREMPLPSVESTFLPVIGPEGGLTEREVEQARSQGAQLVGLGRRVLRIETAALALTATLGLSLLDGSN